jgi:hypothetical protein
MKRLLLNCGGNVNEGGKMRLCCGRACEECMLLRLQQKINCVLKKDNAATLSSKRKNGKAAEEAMLAHLNDLTVLGHEVFDRTKLFPPTTWVWENGGYKDRIGQNVNERTQEEKDFVEVMKEQRSDFTENHFVGVVPRKRRDAGGLHGRPEKILIGHIVVVRNTKKEDLPWYLGEVVKESEEGSSTFTICEYGSACQKKQTDPTKIKWAARFQGTDLIYVGEKSRRKKGGKQVLVTRDEFHLDAKGKPSNAKMKPLLKEITDMHVVEWDTQENVFHTVRVVKHTTQSKNRKRGVTGRTVKKWVYGMVAMNPRMQWGEVEDSSDEGEEKKNTSEEKEGYGEGFSVSSSSSTASSSSSSTSSR